MTDGSAGIPVIEDVYLEQYKGETNMKVIRCKLQQQTAKPINDNQKDYYFACPLKDVEIGDAVLLQYSVSRERRKGDVRRGHSTYVTVGRVEEIFEGKAWDLMEKYHPTATAVCRLEEQFQKYDAFWDRLNKAKMVASSLHKTYDQQEHKIAVVRKSKRREEYERRIEAKKRRKEINKKKMLEQQKRKSARKAGYKKNRSEGSKTATPEKAVEE